MKNYLEKAKTWLQGCKRKCRLMVRRLKGRIIQKAIAYEKKKGLSTRCEWCKDNIFCDHYCSTTHKKGVIARCADQHSEK